MIQWQRLKYDQKNKLTEVGWKIRFLRKSRSQEGWILNRLLKLTTGKAEQSRKAGAKSSENEEEYSGRLLISATKRDL